MEAQKQKVVREIIKTPLDVEVGARLRYVRKDYLKLSQKEFAKETNMKQSSISAYETGERSVSVELLCAMHLKFGILPTYITVGVLPIKEGADKASAVLTDMKELKSQYAALEGKFTELEKKFSYILKTKLK